VASQYLSDASGSGSHRTPEGLKIPKNKFQKTNKHQYPMFKITNLLIRAPILVIENFGHWNSPPAVGAGIWYLLFVVWCFFYYPYKPITCYS